MSIVVQRIKKNYPAPIDVGIKYFSILSVLNNLKLTKKEIQLMAFTATRGIISSYGSKESFYRLYGSTPASLGNMVGALLKRKLLIKVDKRITINPILSINFDNTLVLQITLSNG